MIMIQAIYTCDAYDYIPPRTVHMFNVITLDWSPCNADGLPDHWFEKNDIT